jgi:hypothetical protein
MYLEGGGDARGELPVWWHILLLIICIHIHTHRHTYIHSLTLPTILSPERRPDMLAFLVGAAAARWVDVLINVCVFMRESE